MSLAVLRSLVLWVILTHPPGRSRAEEEGSADLDPYREYLEEISRTRGLPIRHCEICGVPFIPYVSKRRRQRFCSPTCRRVGHLERNRIRRWHQRRTPEGRAKKRRENRAYRENVANGNRIRHTRSARPRVDDPTLLLQKVREILASLSRFGAVPNEQEVVDIFDEVFAA
ncbi:MAG: hypothetical protein JXA57_16030 [Armatimonadetes bacterium]|nr:hypothetical protein [Armatimonadota bacterium]